LRHCGLDPQSEKNEKSNNNYTMALSLSMTERYTYADYLTWTDNKRRELIDGFIRLFMTPAPVMPHQFTITKLGNKIFNYIEDHKGKCRIFYAPFDVRLPNAAAANVNSLKKGAKYDKKVYTVVQPDICIICDPNKLDFYGCIGSPDFICEITSTSKQANKFDRTTKFALYERHKVKEYWIVDPIEQNIDCYYLGGENGDLYEQTGHYDYKTSPNGFAPIKIFLDCKIKLRDIFE
jgi:Uma2 family endonuclease